MAMRPNLQLIPFAFALLPAAASTRPAAGQSRPDLYQCEGCEAIYEHSHADLGWSTVIAPPGEPGDRMVLVGRVVRTDGETPAPGVIVYAYHTNAGGVYPTRGGEQAWARRHGYLRGWAKTDADGNYRFETIRPGGYPGRSDPAHVHMIIKEPNRQEYWIDEINFDDDPRVTDRVRAAAQNRGGSGIIHPVRDANGVWQVRRDIVLER
jgi:protocatechuate 3,4-dioxygenase beta subunit